jgi:protein ImuB
MPDGLPGSGPLYKRLNDLAGRASAVPPTTFVAVRPQFPILSADKPAGLSIRPRLDEPIDDNPGARSVPRSGGRLPGARWARDDTQRPSQSEIEELPAHQRSTMHEIGRRSESAEHPFKSILAEEGGARTRSAPALTRTTLWGRPTILIARTGQRDVVTAVWPVALELGLRPGMAASHACAMVSDLEVRDADPDADRAWLERLASHAVAHWTPTACVAGAHGLWLDLTGTTHLFGGEARFCRRLFQFLERLGFTASIAIAGTPGSAYALRATAQLSPCCRPARRPRRSPICRWSRCVSNPRRCYHPRALA